MKSLLGLLIGCTLVAGGAMTANADASSNEIQRKRTWQVKYQAVVARKNTAQRRVDVSETLLREARQRDRLKGQHRVEVFSELDAARQELAASEKALTEFPENARRAGVPPGWLREFEEREADS
jgi:hypothetical protein